VFHPYSNTSLLTPTSLSFFLPSILFRYICGNCLYTTIDIRYYLIFDDHSILFHLYSIPFYPFIVVIPVVLIRTHSIFHRYIVVTHLIHSLKESILLPCCWYHSICCDDTPRVVLFTHFDVVPYSCISILLFIIDTICIPLLIRWCYIVLTFFLRYCYLSILTFAVHFNISEKWSFVVTFRYIRWWYSLHSIPISYMCRVVVYSGDCCYFRCYHFHTTTSYRSRVPRTVHPWKYRSVVYSTLFPFCSCPAVIRWPDVLRYVFDILFCCLIWFSHCLRILLLHIHHYIWCIHLRHFFYSDDARYDVSFFCHDAIRWLIVMMFRYYGTFYFIFLFRYRTFPDDCWYIVHLFVIQYSHCCWWYLIWWYIYR